MASAVLKRYPLVFFHERQYAEYLIRTKHSVNDAMTYRPNENLYSSCSKLQKKKNIEEKQWIVHP